MRNKKNTSFGAEWKRPNKQGQDRLDFFYFFFDKIIQIKRQKRQFVCCRFYQQSLITNQVNTCAYD